MKPTTKAQRAAMFRLYERARHPSQDNPTSATYRQFRRRFFWTFDCLAISIWGMQIGIEKDGYTHS